ncbi:hypothetical protein Tco_0806969 [Tanacetum coccineum]
MAPKRTTRSTPAATTTTTTTITDAHLKALIDQGVANALAACDVKKTKIWRRQYDSGKGFDKEEAPLLMETMFRIRNCYVENQIKFVTCTLLGSALTWWNSHVKTVGHDVTHAMTWKNLKNKLDASMAKGRD